MNHKTIVILSGGMDSTTLLWQLKNEGHNLHAVSFNYGQRHLKELDCARRQCEALQIDHTVLDLKPIFGEFLASCSVLIETKGEVKQIPEGHYADLNMKATVVPNRNMILLSLATGFGLSHTPEGWGLKVAYGAHEGDHDIYPDCRSTFVMSMREVLAKCDWKPVELLTPFIGMTKGQIVRQGIRLGVQYDATWSCYKGEARACGRCGTCVERLEAFASQGFDDPLGYEDRLYWTEVSKVKLPDGVIVGEGGFLKML